MSEPTTSPVAQRASADRNTDVGVELFTQAQPGDSSFDTSLRLLTALVLIGLVGSICLLAYRSLAPGFSLSDATRTPMQKSLPPPAPASIETAPTKGDEVLMAPGRVFRCEEQGRVSFSDQACPGASAPGRAPGGAAAAR